MENENKIRRKIVLVDDVSFYLVTTRQRLKKYYEVYTAQTDEELFELLARTKPDLILLDIYMPNVDGFEIIKKLKADRVYADIPVIFLTSKNDRKSLGEALNLGAVDFVRKPFTDDALVESIEYHFDPEVRERNKPVILAVDDNQSVLKSVKALLGRDYTIYTLPQPERLEELLSMTTPDLFLLDCKMPVLNGFDLIPIIRKLPIHAETPIVFLSSENTIDTISTAIHFGACDFITKPIDETVLREKISKHLKNYIMWRRIRAIK